jgi:hypothetical protein
MPLKIKNFDNKGQVAVLNKWADQMENSIGQAVTQSTLQTTIQQLTNRIAVLEAKAGS